jgi:hypothetical protein
MQTFRGGLLPVMSNLALVNHQVAARHGIPRAAGRALHVAQAHFARAPGPQRYFLITLIQSLVGWTGLVRELRGKVPAYRG